jgi:L-seryl-tRNA(Ser) seleniumtransferase
MTSQTQTRPRIPSVDEVLKTEVARGAVVAFGRPATVDAIRKSLEMLRGEFRKDAATAGAAYVATGALEILQLAARPNVRPVFNLTGTVLHTNLGRALLAEEAIEAADAAMRQAIALEFDLESGKRGERDALVRRLLCDLTEAEDATIVNNNAAAVLLVLNTFARRKEAVVSRGELIEIGGAFRMPEIMERAGAKLVEIGTTNRTHAKDYVAAIGAKTGLVLKVHTSNYRIEGFTSEVDARALSEITSKRDVPLVHDLGSGTLVDLARYGLTHEPTVREAVADGADLVTFSGDKLLGGPQAGFIVGRKDLIARVNKNPMKRALRIDKIRLAALEATLRLYRDPERLAEKLPTIRHIARLRREIEAQAHRVLPDIAEAVGPSFVVEAISVESQIGSGALPREIVPSAGIAIRPVRTSGRALLSLSAAFRNLPIPVIGHIADQALCLDLRCLDDEAGFRENIAALILPAFSGKRSPEAAS